MKHGHLQTPVLQKSSSGQALVKTEEKNNNLYVVCLRLFEQMGLSI